MMLSAKRHLKFLAPESILLGEVHPVWDSTEHSVIDARNLVENVLAADKHAQIQPVTQGFNMLTVNNKRTSYCPLISKLKT